MIRTVYVIGIAESPVKVGVADDMNKRIVGLQVGCPDELKVHHLFHTRDWAAPLIERAVHKELAPHHRRGEWFNVTADEALAVIERIAPSVLAGEYERRRVSTDLFEQISAECHLLPWANDVLGHYKRTLTSHASRVEVEAMNSAIRRSVGTTGLIAFQTFMNDKTALALSLRRDPIAHRKAIKTIGEAINALVIFVRSEAERSLLDEIQGIVA